MRVSPPISRAYLKFKTIKRLEHLYRGEHIGKLARGARGKRLVCNFRYHGSSRERNFRLFGARRYDPAITRRREYVSSRKIMFPPERDY